MMRNTEVRYVRLKKKGNKYHQHFCTGIAIYMTFRRINFLEAKFAKTCVQACPRGFLSLPALSLQRRYQSTFLNVPMPHRNEYPRLMKFTLGRWIRKPFFYFKLFVDLCRISLLDMFNFTIRTGFRFSQMNL